MNTIMHVLNSTKCHVYWKIDHKSLGRELFIKIKPLPAGDLSVRSTLNGLRSICWSKYHRVGTEEAIEFIKKALEDDPNCDLWHFILGKNLRRIRRDSSVGSLPSPEETNSFYKAYKNSKNALYGIYVAQMLREKRQNDQAAQMYLEIYKSNPKSDSIYLRLALGFIQLFQLNEALMCLEHIAATCSNDCTYMHYKGMYLMKKKRFNVRAYEEKKKNLHLTH